MGQRIEFEPAEFFRRILVFRIEFGQVDLEHGPFADGRSPSEGNVLERTNLR